MSYYHIKNSFIGQWDNTTHPRANQEVRHSLQLSLGVATLSWVYQAARPPDGAPPSMEDGSITHSCEAHTAYILGDSLFHLSVQWIHKSNIFLETLQCDFCCHDHHGWVKLLGGHWAKTNVAGPPSFLTLYRFSIIDGVICCLCGKLIWIQVNESNNCNTRLFWRSSV